MEWGLSNKNSQVAELVDAGKQRCVGYNRSQDTLFTGSNPVLTTNRRSKFEPW